MGEEALVESQVADAVALIQKLDSDGAAPTVAVWYYYDDAAEWRLILAGPTFDALLPKQEPLAYQKVVEAMAAASVSSLAVSDIKLIRTDASLPGALSFLIGTGPNNIVRAHFTDCTLNGLFIKEMIILRLAKKRR
jgi:hypothetical protein